MEDHPDLTPIDRTLRKTASVLDAAGIPFLVGGGLACWARGGPRVENDVDIVVVPDDAQRALDALVQEGMRPARIPESWLLKAHDGDVTVDIIFDPLGVEVTRELVERADRLQVLAMTMRVMDAEDVLVSRVLAIDEHKIDFTTLVAAARALREQIDWASLAARVRRSPFARAFLVLLEDLSIAQAPPAEESASSVRVRRLAAE